MSVVNSKVIIIQSIGTFPGVPFLIFQLIHTEKTVQDDNAQNFTAGSIIIRFGESKLYSKTRQAH